MFPLLFHNCWGYYDGTIARIIIIIIMIIIIIHTTWRNGSFWTIRLQPSTSQKAKGSGRERGREGCVRGLVRDFCEATSFIDLLLKSSFLYDRPRNNRVFAYKYSITFSNADGSTNASAWVRGQRQRPCIIRNLLCMRFVLAAQMQIPIFYAASHDHGIRYDIFDRGHPPKNYDTNQRRQNWRIKKQQFLNGMNGMCREYVFKINSVIHYYSSVGHFIFLFLLTAFLYIFSSVERIFSGRKL